MVKLFNHNMTAYENAVEMLSESGKAAIIHPTGTGKSFIGFKLCEDNPDEVICWLSPSSYIFETQCDNWAKCGGASLKNIRFFTYSKLMLMSEEEIKNINPAYIVLDEFHRCGAEMWGRGVQNLLSAYPDCPVLGLSATNIRYLDNCRDMADELFDGSIASEMTLGEAIVRGILNPPKYVLSVFSYQSELERYKRRVAKAQSPWVKNEAQKYLEALQRTLENAEGLDEIFDKHMTDRRGKYIVFCADFDHMKAMIDSGREWFSKVDKEPKIYTVYSYDPSASQSFADFKADKDTDHLRLLYCIDALNEGIHLDDISGVILLRPTVSPIVYKQQIGRAMSASKSAESVIFDIVDNISGLYSIDSLREEMNTAVSNLRFLGQDSLIVNERFKILDEVKDCRELFERLEHTLSASWEQMLDIARSYYEENDNLLPPSNYTTAEGYRLGQWVVAQRTNYKMNLLSEERIKLLESVGMRWESWHERLWSEEYDFVKAYYAAHGSLEEISSVSQKAYSWILTQRRKYKNAQLSREQIEKLNFVGMVWDIEDNWDINFLAAREYYRQKGNLDIPASYVTPSGLKLGLWHRRLLKSYKAGTLSEDRIKLLEGIGIQWESVQERTWHDYYRKVKEYFAENEQHNIPKDYVADDGKRLGVWIYSQRQAYSKNKLSKEKTKLLEDIGFSWQRDDSRFETGYEFARSYHLIHGNLNVPLDYVTIDGFALGVWISNQRTKKKRGQLSPERIGKLEKLSICWEPNDAMWNAGLEHARNYYSRHGNLLTDKDYVDLDGYRLGAWICNKRAAYRKGTLSEERKAELESVGMVWEVYDLKWRNGYEHAKAYYTSGGGNLAIPPKYVCDDGYKLGEWARSQKKQYKNGKLSDERISLLESIGPLLNIKAV